MWGRQLPYGSQSTSIPLQITQRQNGKDFEYSKRSSVAKTLLSALTANISSTVLHNFNVACCSFFRERPQCTNAVAGLLKRELFGSILTTATHMQTRLNAAGASLDGPPTTESCAWRTKRRSTGTDVTTARGVSAPKKACKNTLTKSTLQITATVASDHSRIRIILTR